MEPDRISQPSLTENLAELDEMVAACKKCERLRAWREEVARVKRRAYLDWDYWGKGVPGFGDPNARVMILGLAPGAHGSNRTGRMFTGDASGDFLYPALFRAGFCNQPTAARRGDGLELRNVFITAICRCVPPQNKPTRAEIEQCRPYLLEEIRLLKKLEGIVALGRLAFEEVRRIYDVPRLDFAHGAFYELGAGRPWLLASYHPSRQNTQTGRLSEAMFDQIWQIAKERSNHA